MTVLVAHPSADLYGSDRVLLESVVGLVNSGARVVVTLPAAGPLVTEIKRSGAEVALCPSPVLRKSALSPKGMVRFLLETMRSTVKSMALIRRIKPQVVYVNTITIPLWTVLPRLSGRRVVVHVHEAERHVSAMVRRIMVVPLFFATSVVSNSQFTSDTLLGSFRKLASKIMVIHNGVPGPTDVVMPRNTLESGPRIVCVGRLSERKGIDVLVDALAQLHEMGVRAQLDVVGSVYPGNEGYESFVMEQVDRLGVTASVTWHGFQADVWPFLAASDIVVVPSRLDESFGNSAVEAVLAARPVIASDKPGLREAVEAYPSAQFVPPGNSQSLARAIEATVHDWPSWRDAAAKAASDAAVKHDPQLYRNRLVEQLTGYAAVRGSLDQ